MLQGIVEAARSVRSPVILQVSAGARKYAGHNYLVKMVEAAAMDADIPIALHLDHGADFEICKAAIDGGFNSVMIDGSHHPFEENIRLTKQVVDYADERGVFVEAELGQLAGVEEHVSAERSVYTDPDQALEFVHRTGCHSLAIAIGTSHGAYKFKGDALLDFDRLRRIHSLLPNYPLVLHGASSVPADLIAEANRYGAKIQDARGVPEDMLRDSTEMGIAKINIDTDLRLAAVMALRKSIAGNPEEFDPRKFFGPVRESIRELVQHKMRHVLGSAGRADEIFAGVQR
jgi:fructose-bisphosphate aldolase class II